MNTPTTAVVIPAYNRSTTLRRCLDSVLGQTVTPSEVIVVDDGSTDGTADVAREYADRGVRCITMPENAGAQAARNRGIVESRAEWIAFLDSDDEWLPGKLERQIAALDAADFDPWTVVHGSGFESSTGDDSRTRMTVPVVDGRDVYAVLLREPGPMFPAMVVSRVALEKIEFLDEAVPSYQEWDTAIRLAKHCRFVFIDEPLFVYHAHEGPTISASRERDIEGYQYVMAKFENEIKRLCGATAWERHLRFQLVRSLNWGMWETADSYFARMTTRDREYRVLQVCRRLHLPPSTLTGLRRRLRARPVAG